MTDLQPLLITLGYVVGFALFVNLVFWIVKPTEKKDLASHMAQDPEFVKKVAAGWADVDAGRISAKTK